jgi:hypothetical protein
MRVLVIILALLGVFLVSRPAYADWEVELDGSGSTVSSLQIKSSQRALHYFFAGGTSLDSSWLFITDGYSVDICTDDDTTTETTGANGFSVNILMSHETLSGATPSRNLSRPILGLSLNGVADTGGATNDCIYQVFGPAWILVDFTGGGTTNGSLVSVTSRRAIKE